MSRLRAPFPYFGGKGRAADIIWPRLGNCPNYIEAFAGTIAVLLARPHEPRVETVNDVCCFISNFWRAVQANPDQVAYWADYPVNEADLHARHRWLVEKAMSNVEKVMADPEFYDAKVAGWWVWGQCLWIGSGWCARPEWTGRANAGRSARGIHTDEYRQRPDLSSANGRGEVLKDDRYLDHRRPHLTKSQGVSRFLPEKLQFDRGGRGIAGPSRWKKRPKLSENGQGCGVHRVGIAGRRPNSGGAGGGQGVHAPTLTRQIPQLSGDGSGSNRGICSDGILQRSEGLYGYMQDLATRLRRVRVCCGDWSRVLKPAITTYIGVTGVLLDPPYPHSDRSICYSHDNDVWEDVVKWCRENGEDPKLRIALCGYEGTWDPPAGWDAVAWKAGGGYGRSKRGVENRSRERIWFSPHCVNATQGQLF